MSPEPSGHLTCGYRVWITDCPADWRPAKWNEIPPEAIAIQPLGEDVVTQESAANLVEGFNRVMLRAADRVWAVAVPAAIRVDDALHPGAKVATAATQFPAGRRNPPPGAHAAGNERR